MENSNPTGNSAFISYIALRFQIPRKSVLYFSTYFKIDIPQDISAGKPWRNEKRLGDPPEKPVGYLGKFGFRNSRSGEQAELPVSF
jgi:hypothetical protein